MHIEMPALRPANPHFSSGPCAKYPGWSPSGFRRDMLGRSHRAPIQKARIRDAIDRTHRLLGLPEDYLVAIVPASDTGAFELAMWSLLGPRGIDALSWESFGKGWVTDILRQLKLGDVRVFDADYGDLPDLSGIDFDRDVVFTWNGTTSGVRVPNGDWIAADRRGLTLCDATSAAFAQHIDWTKIDVGTFSWQKVLGGEAQHGILVLSPRAVERLEGHVPDWPMPKLFRLTKNGKLNRDIFEGATINTPSMLCVEDYHGALDWAESIGGRRALAERADANAARISDWVERTSWIVHLARDPETRSNTSVCLVFSNPDVASLSDDGQRAFAKSVAGRLNDEGVAYDIANYRDAPPGLRIWTGSTVEASDIEALIPWIEWAFASAIAELRAS